MYVGIRELKAHLSEYIDKACQGEAVIVTDRGKPVVRFQPLSDHIENLPPGLRRMVEEGKVRYPGPIRKLPKAVEMLPGDDGKTSTDYIKWARGCDQPE
ncbi:MAG TPA: type II toxin-antitoxin system prevent-host-death family antitoxin [Chloroflexota bacterium]|jgi:prevent-host-death family protein